MVCSCICQICTCGKHQCPIHGKSTLCVTGRGESCKVTEYSNRYKAHEICPAKPCKPQVCIPESGEFCADTTFRSDFKHFVGAKREPIKYDDSLNNKGNVDSTTMYNKEYKAKEICPSKSCKPEYGYCKPDCELASDTTQRSDFRAWPQDRRLPCKRVSYTKSNVPS